MSDPASALAIATLEQLVRVGALDSDDLSDMAERLEQNGEDEAAHWARCAALGIGIGSTSDERAEDARAKFRAIDGGNRDG